MNIVVIGSCTDSSVLAKELNKRMSNSIVFRFDLLKTIKNLVFENTELDLPLSTEVGTYVGDVEMFDYSSMTEADRNSLKTSIQKISEEINKVTSKKVRNGFCTGSMDALTNAWNAASYSIIKVFSGLEERTMKVLLKDKDFCSNTIVINVKKPKTPITNVYNTKEQIERLKDLVFHYVESTNIEDVFNEDLLSNIIKQASKEENDENITIDVPSNNAKIGELAVEDFVGEEPMLAEAA